MQDEPRRFRFTRASRISGERAFEAVFAAKVRRGVGPFVFYGRSNGLGMSRLGLSIGRRVGNAVVRNGIKRLLREAFRLDAQQLPRGIDLVVVVKPHSNRTPTTDLELVRAAVLEGARSLERALARRAEGAAPGPPSAQSSAPSGRDGSR